jgi:hypothetical protein
MHVNVVHGAEQFSYAASQFAMQLSTAAAPASHSAQV